MGPFLLDYRPATFALVVGVQLAGQAWLGVLVWQLWRRARARGDVAASGWAWWLAAVALMFARRLGVLGFANQRVAEAAALYDFLDRGLIPVALTALQVVGAWILCHPRSEAGRA